MYNQLLRFINKPHTKTFLFWIFFWVVQSVLMSGGQYVGNYLIKNSAIVGLQIAVVYINLKVLFPLFFQKGRHVFYILSSILLVYLTFSVSFFFIELALSLISPTVDLGGVHFSKDFWRILSGSSFYSLALVCSTLYKLFVINRTLEKEKEKNSEIIIHIKDGTTSHRMPIDQVYFIEGMREYVAWNTEDKKIISLQSLKSIEEKYRDQGLIRVHKSYIVNTAKISSFSKKSLEIANQSIPIGKIYRNNLKV